MENTLIKKTNTFSITYFLSKGKERSLNVKKNILANFLIKIANIFFNLLSVTLLINFLTPIQYGTWITLTSIIGWFAIFDIGIANGLRNKLTESIAKGKYKLVKIYVSTAYAIMGSILCLVIIVFIFSNNFINWIGVLNISAHEATNISSVVLITFLFFCLQLFLQTITTLLIADQRYSQSTLISLISNIVGVCCLFIITKTTSPNLLSMALCFGIAPVLVLVVSSLWFYTKKYKRFAPSLFFIKKNFIRGLMTLGIKFFFIQIGALILFQTSIFIANQILGQKFVVELNIQYKLFSLIIVFFGIFLAPLWSSFTDAYSKNDFEWIKKTYYKTYKLWFIIVSLTFLLFALSPYIFKVWLGSKFESNLVNSLAMCLYVCAYTWLMMPCFFLNGVGKIMLQFYLYMVCIIINIPLSIFFAKSFGISGIICSNALIFCIMGYILSIQSKAIINKRAVSIWNK